MEAPAGTGIDLIAVFQEQARAAGAQVTVVGTPTEAMGALRDLLSDGVRCTAAVRRSYPELYQALADAGYRPIVVEEIADTLPDRSALAAALASGTGLIVAHAGIAETGSLLLADDALAPRLLGMLADVCVALLAAPAILPSLDDAGKLLAHLEREGHRYLSLVTGPSRTADIERVLTIGVQGPKALHILLFTSP